MNPVNDKYCKLFIVLILSCLCACAVRKNRRRQPFLAKETVKNINISDQDSPNNFFLAKDNSDSSEQDVTSIAVVNAAVARLQTKSTTLAKLKFFTLGGPDYVLWTLCQYNQVEGCKEGRTMKDEVFLGYLSEGHYRIYLQACFGKAGGGASSKDNCSSPSSLVWWQDSIKDKKFKKLLARKADLEEQRYRLISELEGHLILLEKHLKYCSLNSSIKNNIFEQLRIQIKNLRSLGHVFIDYAIDGFTKDSISSAIKKAKEDAITKKSKDKAKVKSTDNKKYNPNYKPEGLSLAESISSQANTIRKAYDNVKNSPPPNSKRIERHLQGSSGWFNDDGSQIADPQVNPNSSLLSKILTNPDLSRRERLSYGSYELLNQVLNIQNSTKKFQLHLAEETTCPQFEVTKGLMNTFKDRVNILNIEYNKTLESLNKYKYL